MANIYGGKQLGEKGKCLGVHISAEMHKNLVNCAREKQLSISDIVRAAIREYFEKEAV